LAQYGIEYFFGCCARSHDNRNVCGVDKSIVSNGSSGTCFPLAQPGVVDEKCPLGDPNPYTLEPLPGCCTPDGICGVMRDYVGLGCSTMDSYPPVSCAEAATLDAGPDASNDGGTEESFSIDSGPTPPARVSRPDGRSASSLIALHSP
jgi:hypothetical protein